MSGTTVISERTHGMEPDQDPRVPAPRDGGRETAEDGGYPFLPFVPIGPRAVPASCEGEDAGDSENCEYSLHDGHPP